MRTLALGALAALILVLSGAEGVSTGFAQETQVKLGGSALIDHWVKAKWDDGQLKPAKRADDAEWMRRAYLDIVGVIPSLEEAEKFLADKAMSKRQMLVEKLLKDPRYADHWADVWSGVIVGFDKDQRAQGPRNQGAEDIEQMLAKNLPYDEFARKVVTVEGHVMDRYNPGMMMEPKKGETTVPEVGLASYVVRQFREAQRDFPKAMAGKLSRAFMGVQIQCAQCHDHPFDKWTQEEFYGMASFFTEVQVRREADETPNRGYIVSERQRGPVGRRVMGGADLSIPDSKTGPIKPAFLETGKGAEAGTPRRQTFAKYLTSPENLQFARMAVNRYWSHFFGAGIVNPVDDFNGKNKPTHPELIDALAKDFIAHKFDLHWLIKAIAGSEAYHLTSKAPTKDRDPQAEKFLALHRVRALAPEQIVRSVVEAARLDEGEVGKRMFGKDGPGRPAAKIPGMRGGDTGRILMMLTAQFRNTFDDDEGSESVDFTGTIPSALLMMNNPILTSGMQASRFTGFGDMLGKHASAEDKLRAVYLSCLSRPPSGAEASRWKAHIAKASGAAGYEDCMWTLLNTSEFLFNH